MAARRRRTAFLSDRAGVPSCDPQKVKIALTVLRFDIDLAASPRSRSNEVDTPKVGQTLYSG
jgi:hypothetical protein